MTKRINILLIAFLALLPAMASAQLNRQVAVSVPFSFVANERTMPAGDYTIELNRGKGIMILRSHDAPKLSVSMSATNFDSTSPSSGNYVSFRHYGNQYFLAEVVRQDAGQSILRGNMEREVAKEAALRPATTRLEAKLIRR